MYNYGSVHLAYQSAPPKDKLWSKLMLPTPLNSNYRVSNCFACLTCYSSKKESTLEGAFSLSINKHKPSFGLISNMD